MKKALIALSVVIVIITTGLIAYLIFSKNNPTKQTQTPIVSPPAEVITDSTEEPTLTYTTLVNNLNNPWDITFVDENVFFFPERNGAIHMHNMSTNKDMIIERPDDIAVMGEGGLMGMVADVDFANNHYLYTCMNVKNRNSVSVSLVRWTVADDLTALLSRKDIITGIPSNESGRHSGCRVTMSKDGVLWVGTGDTAVGTLPQDPKSLGGKVLRVDRDGKGISGNLTEPFDNRIFNYGHRNIQGIFIFDEPIDGSYGITAEHGPDKDDEVNMVIPKGNYGWDPISNIAEDYNEGVPMTDIEKYPDAVPALWSTGDPTHAISGLTVIFGSQWKAWSGSILVAALKDQYIRILTFEDLILKRDEVVIEGYGRIRAVVQGKDGNLYFTTDNGNDKDVIVKVTPK